MKNHISFNTSKLDKIFNVNSNIEQISFDVEGTTGCEGELNPFYGKKHTEKTKEIISQKILKLCENESFRMSRANFGENNGMYGSNRCGKSNPFYGKKHTEESKKKQSDKRKEWFKNNANPLKGKPCLESTKKILSEKNSKEYKLVSPEGKVVEIKNLTKFAEENNLSIGCLHQVASGRNKTHKGWKKYE